MERREEKGEGKEGRWRREMEEGGEGRGREGRGEGKGEWQGGESRERGEWRRKSIKRSRKSRSGEKEERKELFFVYMYVAMFYGNLKSDL